MKRIDVVYGLIYNEEPEKVLLVHNIGSTWSLPGGFVEEGETLEQAIIREVKEETNLSVEVEHLVALNEKKFLEKGTHVVFFTFKVNVLGGEIVPQVEEIDDYRWMTIEEANEWMPYHEGGVKRLLAQSIPYAYQE